MPAKTELWLNVTFSSKIKILIIFEGLEELASKSEIFAISTGNNQKLHKWEQIKKRKKTFKISKQLIHLAHTDTYFNEQSRHALTQADSYYCATAAQSLIRAIYSFVIY